MSKVASEMLGRQYYWSYGIPVVTARFFQQAPLSSPSARRDTGGGAAPAQGAGLCSQVAPGGPETLAVQDFSMQARALHCAAPRRPPARPARAPRPRAPPARPARAPRPRAPPARPARALLLALLLALPAPARGARLRADG